MAEPLKSLDDLLANSGTYGALSLSFRFPIVASSTTATATSGYTTAQRIGNWTVPSVTSPVKGYYMTHLAIFALTATTFSKAGLEVDLATLTVSGNASSGLAAMPTRKVYLVGSNQVVADDPYVVITTTLVATTPVLTITYKNQAGTGSRTATMTLPTNSLVGSAFRIAPHLQSGDLGITEVTAISISTGSAGVIHVYGLKTLHVTGAYLSDHKPVHYAQTKLRLEAADKVGFYRLLSTTANPFIVSQLVLQPET